jgi:hypothetical protein
METSAEQTRFYCKRTPVIPSRCWPSAFAAPDELLRMVKYPLLFFDECP